jgi:predicted alpha/beta-hydrolase family hydrolase
MNTSFLHFHNSKTQTLDVILHGGSQGIDSSLIQKLFESSKKKGNSVIAFNFLYLEKGSEQSSGPELKEELEALKEMLSLAQSDNYTEVRLIAKSLGGIVASFYLNELTEESKKRYQIIVLGYVTGDVKLKEFAGKITIVQGEKDKFGNIDVVKKDLENAVSKEITYYEVKDADHSYRVPETKEPLYEDDVIKLLNNLE